MAEKKDQQKVNQEEPSDSTIIPPIRVDLCMEGPLFGVSVPEGKVAWLELVGLGAEDAKKKIKEEMTTARVQVVPPDHFVTVDFNLGRVRLYIDSSGKVARPPQIG